MMHVVLFIFYFLLLCLAIKRMHFFRNFIRYNWLILFFSIHIAAACIHTWIAFRYFPGHGDIWAYFNESTTMKAQLLQDPQPFFHQMFHGLTTFNLTDKSQPILVMQYQSLLYVNVFLNFASFNNLYINTLLFSFPVFAGTIALFRFFYIVYSNPLPAFCTLLLPSVLFWTSELYKDGIFIMSIGFFLYYLLPSGKPLLRKWLVLIACIVLIIYSRANALITLFPALFFFFLAEKKLIKTKWALCITIAAAVIIFVIMNVFTNGNIIARIGERQRDFQLLAGGSRIFLPLMPAGWYGLVALFPIALFNGFFQPLPGAGGKMIYNLFSVELLAVWATVLFACRLMLKKGISMLGNTDIACLIFAVPGMIIIGYMVPFAGTIVRYRSIYLIFLLAPFLNVIGNYQAVYVQSINNWLQRNVMLALPGKRM